MCVYPSECPSSLHTHTHTHGRHWSIDLLPSLQRNPSLSTLCDQTHVQSRSCTRMDTWYQSTGRYDDSLDIHVHSHRGSSVMQTVFCSVPSYFRLQGNVECFVSVQGWGETYIQNLQGTYKTNNADDGCHSEKYHPSLLLLGRKQELRKQTYFWVTGQFSLWKNIKLLFKDYSLSQEGKSTWIGNVSSTVVVCICEILICVCVCVRETINNCTLMPKSLRPFL